MRQMSILLIVESEYKFILFFSRDRLRSTAGSVVSADSGGVLVPNKAPCKRLAGAGAAVVRHRGHAVACVGNGDGCVAGEARVGAMVGGCAVVADDLSYVGSNRSAAVSVGDSVSWALTEGEGRG